MTFEEFGKIYSEMVRLFEKDKDITNIIVDFKVRDKKVKNNAIINVTLKTK